MNQRICAVTAMATPSSKARTHHVSTARKAEAEIETQTSVTETILARSGIARFCRKLRIYVPKCLLANSRWYNFGELRHHRAAVSNRKGVVGNSGKKIPATPNPNETAPKTK